MNYTETSNTSNFSPSEKINLASSPTTRFTTFTYDAPDKKIAAFIDAAQSYQRNRKISSANNALMDIAVQAAHAHQNCLRSQMIADICAYPYLYSTDKGRFAISRFSLRHAAKMAAPDTIREAALTSEDLAATCFINDYKLAAFVCKANCGSFHGATEPRKAVHHNTVILDGENCLIRSNNAYIPAEPVIAAASGYVRQMYETAFKTQLALCSLYLSMATPVAG